MEAYGSDIGKVLCTRQPWFDGNDFLAAPEVEGAILTLEAINRSGRFGPMMHLITVVKGPIYWTRTRQWLMHHRVPQRTNIHLDYQVHYLADRNEKSATCRRLKTTHYTDDRDTVIEALIGIVPNLYFFFVQENAAKNSAYGKNLPLTVDKMRSVVNGGTSMVYRVHSHKQLRHLLLD